MDHLTNVTDGKFDARVVDLTPSLAAELLLHNPRNRRVSQRNYEIVLRAITQGEWELNGEAVKISVDGEILDGQHRCRAVVESGITIRTLMITGLPPAVQDTMDTGKSRSLQDVLHIRGESNSVTVASLIRKLYINEVWGLEAAAGRSNGYPTTNRELLTWFEKNPWVRDYSGPGQRVGRAIDLPTSLASLLILTFDVIDREDSGFFWDRLVDGVGLDATDSIYVLKRALKTLADDTRGSRNQRYLAAIIIKAWNAYRAGDSISLLKFRAGGAKPEAFPEPK